MGWGLIALRREQVVGRPRGDRGGGCSENLPAGLSWLLGRAEGCALAVPVRGWLSRQSCGWMVPLGGWARRGFGGRHGSLGGRGQCCPAP